MTETTNEPQAPVTESETAVEGAVLEERVEIPDQSGPRARKTTAETAPESSTESDDRRVGFTVQWIPRIKAAGQWVGREFEPPQFWSQDVPSLEKTRRYAWCAEYTGEETPWRTAGIWYMRVFALPVRTVLLFLDWLVQAPARLSAAIFLAFLIFMSVREMFG